jgi:hypothetical protein
MPLDKQRSTPKASSLSIFINRRQKVSMQLEDHESSYLWLQAHEQLVKSALPSKILEGEKARDQVI